MGQKAKNAGKKKTQPKKVKTRLPEQESYNIAPTDEAKNVFMTFYSTKLINTSRRRRLINGASHIRVSNKLLILEENE